jgi:hypothetical protein
VNDENDNLREETGEPTEDCSRALLLHVYHMPIPSVRNQATALDIKATAMSAETSCC